MEVGVWLSRLQEWLGRLNLDWLTGLLGGAAGMWILSRAWDVLWTRRKERREVSREIRRSQLNVVEEYLKALSGWFTTMRYTVVAFAEGERRAAQARQAGQTKEEDPMLDSFDFAMPDLKKIDDMTSSAVATLDSYPTLKAHVAEIVHLAKRTEQVLTEPMEQLLEDIAKTERSTPEKLKKQRVQKVFAKHRRNITDSINTGVSLIDEARVKIASGHAEIARLRQK